MKKKIRKKRIIEVLFFIVLGIFSFWLMFHTFSYNSKKSEIIVASRVWSDFGAHIPLIRSFSLGNNLPPEYPLFPGEPIRYHFLFYAVVGFLERIGIRIDFALNIPSGLGFLGLLIVIYQLAVLISRRRLVGVLAILFFLFNGTLSFLNFFKKFPVDLSSLPSTLYPLLTLKDFPSFGPWDGNLVTAFTHLNVYTNQRHLAPSFALSLLLIYVLLRNVKPSGIQALLVTVVFSTLLFMNQAALLPTLIICAFIFVFVSASRIPLIIGSLFSLPFLLLFYQIALPTGSPVFEPGYLSPKPFVLLSFMQFWTHNLGLHLLLIPLGIVFIKKPYRWLAVPLLIIFIIPNLFRLSTDMINNHKLFNFFMIFGGIYTAVAIVQLFNRHTPSLLKVFIVPILLLLTFSGMLDFLVIKNDYRLTLDDLPKNKDVQFIALATQPGDVILNSTWFYHPASLAGRNIYNGYAFFTWSAGYDTYKREALVKEIYRSEDQARVCQLLGQENIGYVELNRQPDEYIQPISTLWKTMSPVFYDNQASGIKLFKVKDICQTN